jgi:hypothetical protein
VSTTQQLQKIDSGEREIAGIIQAGNSPSGPG